MSWGIAAASTPALPVALVHAAQGLRWYSRPARQAVTVAVGELHLLNRSELVADVPPANLCVAAMLHLNAGNGGHLQLPDIVLKEVAAGTSGCQAHMPWLSMPGIRSGMCTCASPGSPAVAGGQTPIREQYWPGCTHGHHLGKFGALMCYTSGQSLFAGIRAFPSSHFLLYCYAQSRCCMCALCKGHAQHVQNGDVKACHLPKSMVKTAAGSIRVS